MRTILTSLTQLSISSMLVLAMVACSDDSGSSSGNTGGTSGVGGSGTGGAATTGGSGGGTMTGGTGGAATTGGTGGAATGGAGTGGAATGGTGGGMSTGSAPEPTLEAIKAFIAAGTYKEAPWVSDSSAPRGPLPGSGHGRVQVWYNDTALASIAAGNGMFVQGQPVETAHTTGTMSVKELYDDADALVGVAVILKTDGGVGTWAYYGEGPAERIGEQGNEVYTPAAPFFADSGTPACFFCHGQGYFLGAPPAP